MNRFLGKSESLMGRIKHSLARLDVVKEEYEADDDLTKHLTARMVCDQHISPTESMSYSYQGRPILWGNGDGSWTVDDIEYALMRRDIMDSPNCEHIVRKVAAARVYMEYTLDVANAEVALGEPPIKTVKDFIHVDRTTTVMQEFKSIVTGHNEAQSQMEAS